MPRLLSYSLRCYCYFIAIAIIVLAVSLQSLRLFAPQINYFRPSIEQFLSTQLDANVSLGAINATWYGLRPHVLVDDIVVSTQTSQDPLSGISIERADFTVDLLNSLLQLQWVWKKVAFDNIQLSLEESPEGGWNIGGLSFTSKDDASWRYHSPAELFNSVSQIDLKHADIQLRFANGKLIRSKIPSIKIENTDGFHRLTASAAVEGKDVFRLILEEQSGVLKDNYLTAYVQLEQFPLNDLVEGLTKNTVNLNAEPATQSSVSSQLWFDFKTDKTFDVVGHMALSGASQSALAKQYFLNVPVSSEIHGSFHSTLGWSLGLRNLLIDDSPSFEQILVQQDKAALQVLMGDVSLTQWLPWLQKNVVPEGEARAKLASLDPKGELKNMTLELQPEDWRSSTLAANAHNLSVQASDNIPGLERVNGYFETSLSKGFINLSAKQFEIFPKSLYDAPITFDHAQGQVAWTIDPPNNQIAINSSQLQGHSGFGVANGYFSLDIPWDASSRKSNFILYLGLQDSSVEYYEQLVPKRIPEDLQQWLSTSVIKGSIDSAGFIYRGGFSGEDVTRSVQLFLDVADVDLAYSEDWPILTSASGQVLVDNQYVAVNTQKAKVVNEPVEHLSVVWSGDKRKELSVDVKSEFSSNVGLHFLNNTWLRTKVGNTFIHWSSEGNIKVDVNVNVPLLASAQNDGISPKQRVAIEFIDNTITLGRQNLPLEKVSGKLLYSESDGLYSDDLSLSLFDHHLALNIKQHVSESSGEGYLSISGDSSVGIEDLATWLEIPEISLLEGDLPYSLNVEVPFEKKAKYVAKVTLLSNLVGVASPLPAPFYKEPEQARDFRFVGLVNDGRASYSLVLDNTVDLLVETQSDSIKGALALGKNTKRPIVNTPNTFSMKAALATFNTDEWLGVVSKVQGKGQQASPKVEAIQLHYDLSVQNLQFKETAFHNVLISGSRKTGEWELNLENDLMKGTAIIDESFTQPVRLAFDYLNIPKNNHEEIGESLPIADPLAGIDMSLVKRAEVTIGSLIYNEIDLGQWRFIINPSDNGIRIDELYGEFSEMSLSGVEEDTGASLLWRKNKGSSVTLSPWRTDFEGRLQGGNIHGMLEDWGQSPVLESRLTDINISTSWEGSPAFFSMARMTGNLQLDMKRGLFKQEKSQASTGILRLFGLFNFNTWTRRLKLDFSDVYKKGVVFDRLTSRLIFDNGLIHFQEPLVLKSPSSEFTMAGTIDYPNENIDTVLVTTLPVGGNLTFAAAFAAGLPIAAGVYIISQVFKPQVDKAASLTYTIQGSWNDPKVKFLRLFDNKTEGRSSDSNSEEPDVFPDNE